MKKIFFCVGIIFVLFSCTSDNGGEVASKVSVIKLPLEKSNMNLKMSDVVDSICYVSLETDTVCLVGQIDKLIPMDTAFIVVDKDIARSIYVFNREGRFIRKIGKSGPGPEEYLGIEDVCLDQEKGQIVILDLKSKHFLIYSLEGEFVKSIRFDFYAYDIEYVGEDKIAVFLNYGNNASFEKAGNIPTLGIYDLKKEKVVELCAYANEKIRSGSMLNLSENFSSDGMETLFVLPINDTIFNVNSDGISPKYLLDFGSEQRELQKEYISCLIKDQPNAIQGAKIVKEMGLAQVAGLAITEKNQLFSYQRDGQIFMAIQNKKTGHVKSLQVSDMSSLVSDMDYVTLFVPYGTDKDNMYLMVNPYALSELSPDKQTKQIEVLKASFSEENNPIIAVARMKDF